MVHVQTNTINLRMFQYKWFVLRKYPSSCPYIPGMVNHAQTRKRQKLRQLYIRLVRSTMPRSMKQSRLLTALILHEDSHGLLTLQQ